MNIHAVPENDSNKLQKFTKGDITLPTASIPDVNPTNLFSVASKNETEIELMVAETTGYKQNIFDLVKEQFYLTDTPSNQVTKSYQEALIQKLNFLDSFERIAFNTASMNKEDKPKLLSSPEDYYQYRMAQLDAAKGVLGEKIIWLLEQVEDTDADIIIPDGADGKHQISKEDIPEKTMNLFSEKVETIEKLAEEIAITLQEILKTLQIRYHNNQNQHYNEKLLILACRNNNIVSETSVMISDKKAEVKASDLNLEGASLEGNLDIKLDALVNQGSNVIIFEMLPELDFQMQLVHVINLHIDKLKSRSNNLLS